MNEESSQETLRNKAEKIFRYALSSVDAKKLLKEKITVKNSILNVDNFFEIELDKFNKIIVLGSGKASVPMAYAIEDILKDRISYGLVVTKYGYGSRLSKLEVVEAGHPVPDKKGVEATEKIIEILKKCGKDDLVIYLLSGGTSALLCAPEDKISLKDKQKITELLLNSGANIKEINTVRKHLSKVKGGKLGRYAHPARVINLILSDTIGDDISITGSGPFVYDKTGSSDVEFILKKYNIFDKLSDYMKKFIEERKGETVKPESKALNNCKHYVIGNNTIALENAGIKAEEYGFNSMILTSLMEGEAREVAKITAGIAKEILFYNRPVKKPACVLCGGETTVTIRGSGKGGRCQEFALVSALEISGLKNVVVLCGGTDGTDGPTDAAGAIVDSFTVERGLKKGLVAEKHLKNNDSYNFFSRTGELIFTGPTNTNIMDIVIILVS
ncbi:glycerate kinase [candidate division KSB1 bacterium]|nr:MAG: glycerate kinase [candidate division KSB1 bacterium]